MSWLSSLLSQLLLLSGTTGLLLCYWLTRNRPDVSATRQPISERRFILASFVSLFLELLLIRWISSELRIFAYLKNFVLIACFLGFGFGANMLGAIAGGFLEAVSFMTGMRFLLLLAGALYLLSAAALPRGR